MGLSAMVWLSAGAAAVCLLAALLASDIQIEASLKRKQNDDTVRIRVTALFGLVRRQKVMRVLPMGDGAGPVKPFLAFTKTIRKLGPWVTETALRVRCEEFVWVTRIGLGDAASSAIAAGAVWSVKSPLVGVFARLVRMQAMPRLAVLPLFNETRFETDLHGRFSIRTASALAAVFRLVVHIVRSRGGVRRWWKARQNAKRDAQRETQQDPKRDGRRDTERDAKRDDLRETRRNTRRNLQQDAKRNA